MREKTLKTYYCDFCKKHYHKRDKAEYHEKHCTLNPDRECGLCKQAQQNREKAQNYLNAVTVKDNIDCPLCAFSYVRLNFNEAFCRGDVYFELREEITEWWQKVNAEQNEAEMRYEINMLQYYPP